MLGFKSPKDKSHHRKTVSGERNNFDRPLKPLNSTRSRKETDAQSMKSISSSSKKSVSSSKYSMSQDNRFQKQHDSLMSRQQFRTNTNRSISKVPSREVNGPASIIGSISYDSGVSHVSRKTLPIPQTIHKTDTKNVGREEHIQNVKLILADLNKATDIERRIAALTNACAAFDHWDTERHNIELSLGCSTVLCLVLSMTDNEDEIRMICAALEMVYRASTEAVRKTFQEDGPSVVPLLLKVLDRCEHDIIKHAKVSLLNVSKVLLYFSRVTEVRSLMAKHDGMIHALNRISTAKLEADARVLRMRVIANLSNSDENKALIVSHPGLLDSILKIAALDMSPDAREYAAASLMDLASSSDAQEKMADKDRLLATLVKLAVTDGKEETREYAVTAIQNLAFVKENRVRLCNFSEGVVIEALKKVLSTDTNDKSRRRAAGALTNLACDETADLLADHDELLSVLASVSTHDSSSDVQKRSCLALTKIASGCNNETENFEALMKALVTASLGSNATGIPAVFRVKARDPVIREEMARVPGLLETLAEIPSTKAYNAKDKENAMRAIMHLTNETENRRIMCNKYILKALVEAADMDNNGNKEIRDSAIVAIERLATEVTNRKYMARHDGLLTTIAKATEREAKAELAGEKQSQPRLAKQLLLSLLVAM